MSTYIIELNTTAEEVAMVNHRVNLNTGKKAFCMERKPQVVPLLLLKSKEGLKTKLVILVASCKYFSILKYRNTLHF